MESEVREMITKASKAEKSDDARDVSEKQTVEIQVWSGASGPCVYINNYRICGPKPWGGHPIHTWQADLNELLSHLPVPVSAGVGVVGHDSHLINGLSLAAEILKNYEFNGEDAFDVICAKIAAIEATP